MEIEQYKPVKINAKTFKLHLKVCDQFGGTLVDSDGAIIKEFEDIYVPGWFPGNHYGDYLILDIDIDTGKITNWIPPCAADIEEFIGRPE
jgi:hypothetical protein